jgi:hypothetical protein
MKKRRPLSHHVRGPPPYNYSPTPTTPTQPTPEPGAPNGYYREVVYDPEAPGYRPPPEPERQMIPGRMLAK